MARKIEIEVTGDTRSLERALSRAGKSTESSFKKMSRAAGVAGLAIGAGLAVAAKMGFAELQQMAVVTAQTEAVLKSTGGEANVTAERVTRLAESIADYAAVDDEAVVSAENLLLTFRNVKNEAGDGAKVFDNATRVTVDLAQAMGMDLNAAALQVGKALNDPIKGMSRLQRIGVTFTKSQEKLIKKLVETGDVVGAQKVILEELNKEFGGSAAAFGETLPGKLKKAQESFIELQAVIMLNFLPAITKLTDLGLRLNEFMLKNPKLAKLMVVGLAALAAALVTASVAQMALNLAVLANPYVLIAASVLAYAAAVVYLAQKFEFARKHWQLFLIVLGIGPVVIATVVKAIIRHFDTLKGAFETVKNVATRVFNAVANSVRVLLTPIFAVISAIRTLIDWINKIPDVGGIVGGIQGSTNQPRRPGRPFRNPNIDSTSALDRLITPRASTTPAMAGTGGRAVILADGAFVTMLRRLDAEERRRNGGKGIL